MNILLLNPPARRTAIRDYYCSKHTKSNYLFHPIDLLIQSGILAPHHSLSALDAVARRLSPAAALTEIERLQPDLILGLWGAATDHEDHEFYAALFRRLAVPIIISGEVVLENTERWLAVRPFIRGALLRFVSSGLREYLASGQPGPDLIVRDGNGFVGGLDPMPAEEFSLDRPRHELFGQRGYRFSFARGRRFATVLTDFGCPFKCRFCVMGGLGYRLRPIEEVVAEWKWLREHGLRELFVTDQCFGARRERTLALCRALAIEAPGMSWTTFSRAELLDPELLSALKEAGCHTLIMGVETADAERLREYHKGLSLERVKAGFHLCRQEGVRAVATFILGWPEDTKESIRATIRLARELDPDFVSYNLAVPRPTTAFRAIAEKESLAAPGVDPDQGGDTAALRTRALSSVEVLYWKRRAVRDFYLRPGYLLRRLAGVKSWQQFSAEVREGLALILKNLY